jgi:hypothetical protein
MLDGSPGSPTMDVGQIGEAVAAIRADSAPIDHSRSQRCRILLGQGVQEQHVGQAKLDPVGDVAGQVQQGDDGREQHGHPHAEARVQMPQPGRRSGQRSVDREEPQRQEDEH